MIHIIRIIPKIKIGGVERGLIEEINIIKKITDIQYHIFVVEKSPMTISSEGNVKVVFLNKKFYNFLFCSSIICDYISSTKIDNAIVLSSLWKSHLVSFFLGRFVSKRISFFHSSKYAHFLDRLISKLAFKFFDKSIYDSNVTKNIYSSSSGCVIPYFFKNESSVFSCSNTPSFVFIGRLNKVKGIDRSLYFIRELVNAGINATFKIYGPDEGELQRIRKIIIDYNIKDNVFIMGELDYLNVPSALIKNTFYLQTSYREGMGGSVIQAQSLGLIPIVTPVGEIPFYCKHAFNSILLTEPFEVSCRHAVMLVKKILESDDELYQLKMKCVNEANNMNDFSLSFLSFLKDEGVNIDTEHLDNKPIKV